MVSFFITKEYINNYKKHFNNIFKSIFLPFLLFFAFLLFCYFDELLIRRAEERIFCFNFAGERLSEFSSPTPQTYHHTSLTIRIFPLNTFVRHHEHFAR